MTDDDAGTGAVTSAERERSSASSALHDVTFDHVAIAVHRITDPWSLFADALGGRYLNRGVSPGFGWTQLRFANGFVLEGLHPEPGGDDFLRRFLERNGPGPHHLTFGVPDIDEAIRVLRSAGLGPVDEHRDRAWSEVFLRPAEAHGVVVQLAEVGPEPLQPPPEPEAFPELPFDHPVASLGRVVHAVKDLEGAVSLFRDVLGGRIVSTGAAVDGNHWVELGWAGPGRLRLLEAAHADIAEWVGDRPGRIRHLFFNFDEPITVPGCHQVGTGRFAVEPDSVLGTRVVLASTAR